MLHKALKILRTFHRKSQSELADELGISKSYLSEIEAGNRRINLEVLEKYSQVFEIPISSILLFSEELDSDHWAEKLRANTARKITKMLEWIAESEEQNERP